jgi:hypothetical protein
MARTPEQWLDVLAKRLDARAAYIALMRRYTDGNAPLPEMGKNLRASWEAFQRKSRANWGGFAVDARADRIVYSGVTVGGSVATAEAKAAALIVRNNRLEVAFTEAIGNCLATGYGYLVVGDDDGNAVVTSEAPEWVIVAQDPIQSWRARAALKVWRDEDELTDYAKVWADGALHQFSRPSMVNGVTFRASTGGWAPDSAVPFDGAIPVFELEGERGISSAFGTYFVGGLSIIDEHTDLIDRINHGVLLRMVTMAMQAFRQRALRMREGSGGLPEKDPNGNVIDYGQVFAPAPGALWEFPEGVEGVWESQQTNIGELLLAVKDDLRSFGALTGAMMPGAASDSENQSAEGARSGKEGLSVKASKFLRRAQPVLAGAMVAALRVEGFEASETVEVKFEPTDRVTLAEKMDAASKAIAAGMAVTTVQREILGWSEHQIAQDERAREDEKPAPAPTPIPPTPMGPDGDVPHADPEMAAA